MTTKPVSKKKVKDLFLRFDSGRGITITKSVNCNSKDILIKDNGYVKTYLINAVTFNFHLVYRVLIE